MRHSAGAWSGKTSEVPRVQISTLVRPDFHARAAQRPATASTRTRHAGDPEFAIEL